MRVTRPSQELAGKRCQIPPYFDLWMRGARYGMIVKVTKDSLGTEIAHIKMDHPQVRRLVKAKVRDLEII
jgi:hypothetical protein